ncbi:MAG: hypothetical protein U5M50_08690 [Sphingobium sp.]|nr:hypothetical protein [Sphingobium sp.]
MSGPRISDHALLRFLDRGCGLDVEGLRAKLQASFARAHEAAEALGGQDHYIHADGLAYLVRHGVVVTVIEPGSAGLRGVMLAQDTHDRGRPVR